MIKTHENVTSCHEDVTSGWTAEMLITLRTITWFDFQHCDGLGCFGESPLRKKRDLMTVHEVPDFVNRDIVCHHCCDGHFCNMYGCPDEGEGQSTKQPFPVVFIMESPNTFKKVYEYMCSKRKIKDIYWVFSLSLSL